MHNKCPAAPQHPMHGNCPVHANCPARPTPSSGCTEIRTLLASAPETILHFALLPLKAPTRSTRVPPGGGGANGAFNRPANYQIDDPNLQASGMTPAGVGGRPVAASCVPSARSPGRLSEAQLPPVLAGRLPFRASAVQCHSRAALTSQPMHASALCRAAPCQAVPAFASTAEWAQHHCWPCLACLLVPRGAGRHLP